MSEYQAPVREMLFVIRELAGLAEISRLPGCEELNDELVESILEQAAKLATDVISPTNPIGDAEGTRVENGAVRVPAVFKSAYRQFTAGGWAGITAPADFGGQSLPFLIGVAVEETPLFGNTRWLGSIFGAVGTSGLILLLAMFMLINREDLRDRLVSLSGKPSLVVATKAFADAGERISRYLVMQFIINATMGLAVGIGLYFIGVPYAALWGLTAAVMRYIPYIGPWLSAVPPAIYALVVDPVGVLWVAALFVFIYQVEGHVVVPNVMASALRLHPLLVIFGLLAGGALYGIAGVLVSLPTMAAGRAIWEFFGERVDFESWEDAPPRPVAVEVELGPVRAEDPPRSAAWAICARALSTFGCLASVHDICTRATFTG